MSRFRRGLTLVTAVLPALALGLAPTAASAHDRSPGAVYALGNQESGNEVIVYQRARDGSLTEVASEPTGGLGTGQGLGSQGAVVLDRGARHLYAVNAGSDTVSSFRVTRSGLDLLSTVPSGGDHPISLTVQDDVLYVLNDGGPGTISGLSIRHGRLRPLAHSTRRLRHADTAPAQVSFTPDGRRLVVSEKAANQFEVFGVTRRGAATWRSRTTASSGATPFGFDFDRRGRLIVSEAAGGAADASSVSSYRFAGRRLRTISASVPTTETAACWIATSKDGRYAFAANTGSATITTFRVARNGSLHRLADDGNSADTSGAVADVSVSGNGQFLYGRNGNGTVDGFAIGHDGSLTPVGSVDGLPSGAFGLAAS